MDSVVRETLLLVCARKPLRRLKYFSPMRAVSLERDGSHIGGPSTFSTEARGGLGTASGADVKHRRKLRWDDRWQWLAIVEGL